MVAQKAPLALNFTSSRLSLALSFLPAKTWPGIHNIRPSPSAAMRRQTAAVGAPWGKNQDERFRRQGAI